MNVVIIGGGWAGLTAAIKLVSQNIPVKVLEAATQLGGRARCVAFHEHMVDSAQQVLYGAYHETAATLRALGISEEEAFHRMPLRLSAFLEGQKQFDLQFGSAPSPFNLILAFVNAKKLSIAEQLSGLQFVYKLKRHRFKVEKPVTAEAMLIRNRQSGRLSERVWEPICLTVLNTPLRHTSAQVFVDVLRDLFFRQRNDSNLLLPRQSLCKLFAEPALQFIEKHKGAIQLKKAVTEIVVKDQAVTGVKVDDEFFDATHVIIATPAEAAAGLLQRIAQTEPVAEQIRQMTYSSIFTLYAQFPEYITLPYPWISTASETIRWMLDRRIMEQPGLIACNVSASRELLELKEEDQLHQLGAELKRIFPKWPKPKYAQLFREPASCFCATLDNEPVRPAMDTGFQGLYLAGDYVATSLPSSVESAVVSGLAAANHIISGPRN